MWTIFLYSAMEMVYKVVKQHTSHRFWRENCLSLTCLHSEFRYQTTLKDCNISLRMTNHLDSSKVKRRRSWGGYRYWVLHERHYIRAWSRNRYPIWWMNNNWKLELIVYWPPNRLWIDNRMVLQSYAEDHLSCKARNTHCSTILQLIVGKKWSKLIKVMVSTWRISKQMFPYWSIFGWKHVVSNLIWGGLKG